MKKLIAVLLSAFVLYYFEWEHVILAKHNFPVYFHHFPAVLAYPSSYLFLLLGTAKVLMPLIVIYYLLRISSEYRYQLSRAVITSVVLIAALFVFMTFTTYLLHDGLSLLYVDSTGVEHIRTVPFLNY